MGMSVFPNLEYTKLPNFVIPKLLKWCYSDRLGYPIDHEQLNLELGYTSLSNRKIRILPIVD